MSVLRRRCHEHQGSEIVCREIPASRAMPELGLLARHVGGL